MPIRSIGESFQLNSSETGAQSPARITELQDGGFVGYWHSMELESQIYGSVLRARIFDDEGRALGDDFVVNQLAR